MIDDTLSIKKEGLNSKYRLFTNALLFLCFLTLILQYNLVGIKGVIRAFLMIVIAISTCTFTNAMYWKFKKNDYHYIRKHIIASTPIITGIIVALCIPLGDLENNRIYLITLLAAFLSEMVAKLLIRYKDKNIFNPAATGILLTFFLFSDDFISPTIDGLLNQSPLDAISSNVDVYDTFSNYTSLLLGSYHGGIGTTMFLPLLIVGIYLMLKKVIDFRIPLVAFVFFFIFLFIIMLIFKYDFNFIIIHLIGSNYLFVVVYMLSDPITSPNDKLDKYIYAILFALIAVILGFKVTFIYSSFIALLIMNLSLPLIKKVIKKLSNKPEIPKII
ncbi:MAG: RnfABCDGE type electron transport complex subunit D [Erysipelotrichales bacterium]